MSDPLHGPPYDAPPDDRSVKIAHLVLALLFLGLAGIWALGTSGAISGERLVVLAPGVLVVAGVIGLVATLANARNRRTTARAGARPDAPADTPADTWFTDERDDETTDPTQEIR